MIKVKQLKLRIFAQFVIIIAPITLVLIYQALSDLRRTTAVESVVVRHGLSRATKDGFPNDDKVGFRVRREMEKRGLVTRIRSLPVTPTTSAEQVFF